MLEEVQKKLKDAGYSLTKPRLTVFGALQGPKPKTMAELVASLEGVIDRASVYRTVRVLEDLDIVHRIQHGWKYRLELSDAYQPHHHHVTCQDCQRVISFDEPKELDIIIDNIVATHGFLVRGHSLEITGLCPQCQMRLEKQKRAV